MEPVEPRIAIFFTASIFSERAEIAWRDFAYRVADEAALPTGDRFARANRSRKNAAIARSVSAKCRPS
jgi:hypothetical protein